MRAAATALGRLAAKRGRAHMGLGFQQRSVSGTVFVGGLPRDVEVRTLTQTFEEYGEVLHVNVLDRPTERLAYVHFNEPLAAMAAVDELHGTNKWGSLVYAKFQDPLVDATFREAYYAERGDITRMIARMQEKVARDEAERYGYEEDYDYKAEAAVVEDEDEDEDVVVEEDDELDEVAIDGDAAAPESFPTVAFGEEDARELEEVARAMESDDDDYDGAAAAAAGGGDVFESGFGDEEDIWSGQSKASKGRAP